VIKAVLFDFWNTLIFHEAREGRRLENIRIDSLTQALSDAGFSVSRMGVESAVEAMNAECDRVREKTGQEFDSRSQVRMILEKRIPEPNEVLLENLWKVFTRAIFSIDLKARDGAEIALLFLKENGYKIGLICNIYNTPGVVIREILRKSGLLRYFDVLMFSDEYGLRKPRSEIFLEALSRMDVKSSEAVHIGDAPNMDILGAKKAGLKAIYLQLTHQPYPSNIPKPDLTIGTLHQIPEAIKKL